MKYLIFIVIASAVFFSSCKNDPKPAKPVESTNTTPAIVTPIFNADSAYAYIQKQTEFGNRVPGTKSHRACGEWIIGKLKSFGAEVKVQDFKSNFFDKKNVPSFNIIASYQPQLTDRIVLAAHWDTRMIGEKDSKMKNKPIQGADDGASGVGNLLEIARLLQSTKLPIGVDLVFFDAEDNGDDQQGWCQGSDYWSKNLHIPGYKAKFGILLDMVGAKNAKFGHESYSKQNAGDLLNKIWAIGQGMGYSDMFVNVETGAINDDHYYVMANAGIPMVDIINRPMQTESGFADHHHTQNDNLSVIDKRTLGAVGKVVTEVMIKYANKTL